MRYLHTMVRVTDVDQSLDFYVKKLGMKEVRRHHQRGGPLHADFPRCARGRGHRKVEQGAAPELTYNWDPEVYGEGRNFGHLAFEVDNIYAICGKLQKAGVTINRPPRDGNMAFIRSPDNISIEILQKGAALPPEEPWKSMPNTGKW